MPLATEIEQFCPFRPGKDVNMLGVKPSWFEGPQCPLQVVVGRKNGLDHGVGHPIGLSARHKHLSTGGKGRCRTPPSCGVAYRG